MTCPSTAQQCDWAATSSFIDAFRRAQGQTPRAYVTATQGATLA